MATEKTTPAATTPVAPSTPAPSATDAYDTMASAFDELLEPTPTQGEGDQSASTTEVDAAAAAAKEPSPAPAAAETPPKEDATSQPETTTTPAVADEATATAEGTTAQEPDWEARFRELEAKIAKPPEAAATEKPPVETPPPDIYSADEKEFLSKYDADWPDVSRGEALKRRAEYSELVGHVFREIARVYGPLVERGAQAADTVAENTTLAAIQRVHNDYDDAMYDGVVEWANGLSGFRGKLAKAVIEEGEPQDVIDLITDYKSAKGLNKPKVVAGTDTASAAPAVKAVTELSAPAKKAAKALGVVDSKRSAVTPGVDPDDFDAAWNEAVS